MLTSCPVMCFVTLTSMTANSFCTAHSTYDFATSVFKGVSGVLTRGAKYLPPRCYGAQVYLYEDPVYLVPVVDHEK